MLAWFLILAGIALNGLALFFAAAFGHAASKNDKDAAKTSGILCVFLMAVSVALLVAGGVHFGAGR